MPSVAAAMLSQLKQYAAFARPFCPIHRAWLKFAKISLIHQQIDGGLS
jgi:hypothetical protein